MKMGYVVLRYQTGDIVGAEFVLERERAELLAQSRQSFAVRKKMGVTYGVGMVVSIEPDRKTKGDDK